MQRIPINLGIILHYRKAFYIWRHHIGLIFVFCKVKIFLFFLPFDFGNIELMYAQVRFLHMSINYLRLYLFQIVIYVSILARNEEVFLSMII